MYVCHLRKIKKNRDFFFDFAPKKKSECLPNPVNDECEVFPAFFYSLT